MGPTLFFLIPTLGQIGWRGGERGWEVVREGIRIELLAMEERRKRGRVGEGRRKGTMTRQYCAAEE